LSIFDEGVSDQDELALEQALQEETLFEGRICKKCLKESLPEIEEKLKRMHWVSIYPGDCSPTWYIIDRAGFTKFAAAVRGQEC